jgi:glucose 1-dehydrogenase
MGTTGIAARPLEGHAALVTGASSGIGAGIARALASAGARVAVNYSSRPDGAEAVVRSIRDAGGDAFAVGGDVSREDDVLRMFGRVVESFGTLHVLVNNAGLQRDAPLSEMSLEQWRTVLDVNLTGQFLCTRQAVREFLRRGVDERVSRAAGKVICVSSVHDVIPWAGHVNYAASKGGVSLFMKSVAQELAERRVRVNAISPGAIRTPINRAAWETPEALRGLLDLIPYGRIGETDDIGRAAVWLASDESDYVNGATLYVDGGMTLYPEFRHGG